MKLATKTIYGIQALFELAQHASEGRKSAEIAKAQKIPVRFLEQILLALKKQQLVKSQRGSRGGYILAKPAKDISLLAIVEALEGPLALYGQGDSVVALTLKELEKELAEKLKNTTLETMLANQARQDSVFTFNI